MTGHKTADGNNFIYENCEYCGKELDKIEQAYFLGLCRSHASNQEGIIIPREMPTFQQLIKHLKYIGLDEPTEDQFNEVAHPEKLKPAINPLEPELDILYCKNGFTVARINPADMDKRLQEARHFKRQVTSLAALGQAQIILYASGTYIFLVDNEKQAVPDTETANKILKERSLI